MKKKILLYLLRAVLCVLILLNMGLIFRFSSESGNDSNQTSSNVTQQIAQTVIKDFNEKPPAEQQKVVQKMNPHVRKLAHMAEFGSLGGLILLLLLTWRGAPILRYFIALFSTLVYACADELHQKATENRAAQLTDIGIDLLGAFLVCSAVLFFYLVFTAKMRNDCYGMKISHYRIQKNAPPLRLAVAADLHGAAHERVIDAISKENPDIILIPGDLSDDIRLADPCDPAYDFLKQCAAIAPTYYSLGNHEIACYHKGNPWRHPVPVPLSDEVKARIEQTGAVLLDNACVHTNGITICGLTSGINRKLNHPNERILNGFATEKGYRILLCHHPEYYVPYIQKTDIELTLCGHAHGGQWRFFGRGTYAPGQGILPKYTAGSIDDRCIVSRGLGNHTWIPRIFNDPELVMIELGQSKE